MEMTVKMSNCKISPQKARLLANAIRDKEVVKAYNMLKLMSNKSGSLFYKLMHSAISNIENNLNGDISKFYVKEVYVDKGRVLKRIMPRAKGRADRILKRYAHLNIKLSTLK